MTIITLTTDFGTEDAYVAEMKGVLCSEAPRGIQLVDLSHAIAAQDVYAAAMFLASAVPRFPAGTIHLAVIDPGVGSTRRPLAVEFDKQWLVVPDNGIASFALRSGARAHALQPQNLGARALSSTFHGRDVFAPAAARLACGLGIDSIALAVDDPVLLREWQPTWEGDELLGQVQHVDHFGNLISNVIPNQHAPHREISQVVCAGQPVGPVRDHYAQVHEGQLLLLEDSHGRLEVAVRNGHAGRTLGVSKGAEFRVRFAPREPRA